MIRTYLRSLASKVSRRTATIRAARGATVLQLSTTNRNATNFSARGASDVEDGLLLLLHALDIFRECRRLIVALRAVESKQLREAIAIRRIFHNSKFHVRAILLPCNNASANIGAYISDNSQKSSYVFSSIFLIISSTFRTNFFFITLSSLCCWRFSRETLSGRSSESTRPRTNERYFGSI